MTTTGKSRTDWMIRGPEIVTCNCDYGCPCQFNAPPKDERCTAIGAMHIDLGHYGNISLTGLRWVSLAAWPGAIHLGNGAIQRIIDIGADEGQRTALLNIMSGKDSVPGTTFFDVFASMIETIHPPLFLPIEFEADMESCDGFFRVPGVVEARTRPIRNPVTGTAHHAKIVLRHGFEFTEAECASGDSTTSGLIELNAQDRHAHLAMLHLTGTGIVR